MGRIRAVCISRKKGTAKEAVEQCRLIREHGLENDAHAGSGRQVSLLFYEAVSRFEKGVNADRQGQDDIQIPAGAFGENLLIEGCEKEQILPGTWLYCGDVVLEITQLGKECHGGCTITKLTGSCIMPREGIFARVIRGGVIRPGDEIITEVERNKTHPVKTAAVITASDRAAKGIYEDKSGQYIRSFLEENGYGVAGYSVLPDDEDVLCEKMIEFVDKLMPDVLFTTGGTGFGPRDRMPEATVRACDRMADGIAEAVRSYSMKFTPNAMLSRGVSGIRKRTLIINLPGSPKAVRECLELLMPVLDHGIRMLRGDHDD